MIPLNFSRPFVQEPDSDNFSNKFSQDDDPQTQRFFPGTAINTYDNASNNFYRYSEVNRESYLCYESNQLNVEEQIICTPVHIESNYLDVEEEVINTTANITSNFLNIEENFIETTASIESNQIDIQETLINTPVRLESNTLEVQENILNTPITIESNKVQVNEHTTEVPVNIVHNSIKVNKKKKVTPVELESNKIELNSNTLETPVNLENNKVTIDEKTYETPVHVEHNKIRINEKTIETPIETISNSITVNEKTLETPVQLEHNRILVFEKTINTPIEATSNIITVNEKSLDTPVQLEHNKIKVLERTLNTPIVVTSNTISVNQNTIDTPVNISNNRLTVNEETIDTVANVVSNSISVREDNIETPVFIENNSIQVLENWIETPVELESNRIHIQNNVIDSPVDIYSSKLHINEHTLETSANITSNNLIVDEKTVDTNVNLVSNSLQINHRTIPTSAIVESHKVNIVEEIQESHVVIPKLVFKFVEEETPINISLSGILSHFSDRDIDSSCNIKTKAVIKPLTISNPTSPELSIPPKSPLHHTSALSFSAPFSYSSGACLDNDGVKICVCTHRNLALSDFSDSEVSVVSNNDEPHVDNSSDDGLSSSNQASSSSNLPPNDDNSNNFPFDDRTPPDPSSSDTEEDTVFTPELLRRDLSNVDNKFDLNNVRTKWNGKIVNDWLFGADNDVIDNPIMWNVVISREWPAVGHFVCPECLKHAEDVNINIRNHVDRVHHTNPIETCHNAVIAKIIGRSHIWRLEKEGNEDTIIESVYTCTVEGCNYFTNCRRNYLSHLRSHKQLQNLVAKFGFFWGPIIYGAKCGRMIKASDVFRDREGFGCPYCDDYFTSSSCGFTQHVSKLHPQHKVEGAQSPSPIRVKLRTLISQEVVDDELTQMVHRISLPSSTGSASQSQHHQEASSGSVSVPVSHSHSHSSSTSQSDTQSTDILGNDNASVNMSDVDAPPITDSHTDHNPSQRITHEDLLRKAAHWLRKCDDEESQGISLPRLNRRYRRRIIGPIKLLFETKVKELINLIRTDSDDKDDWFITQGILARISLLIRKTIRTSLRIPFSYTSKRRVRNKDIEYNRSTTAIKRIFSLTELCDLIERLYEMSGHRETTKLRNAIANVEKRIIDCIQQADDGVVRRLFGGDTIADLRRFMNDTKDHLDAKIEWLRARIIKEEKSYEVMRGHRLEKTIRDFYNEDPRRCAEWYIYGSISPECKVDIHDFESHFREEWKRSSSYDNNSPLLKLERVFDADIRSQLIQKLTDCELIKKVIHRKSNMSAVGPDAISNCIWKMDVTTSSELVSRLISAMLRAGKIPDSWRRSKTVMLFKKGPAEEVKSWRPISLSPTLYRITMGHIANVFQGINAVTPFFCSAQKGFIHNVNGTSEHINTLNELISDASRRKKDINILALDFANAFGSIDHRHIVDSLVGLGFPTDFCNFIKDLYKDNSTYFCVNGEISNSVPMERGVKQGCPFSPILFNICLDALLRNILINHKKAGYSIGDLSFSVQAFADDVVLISHSSDGLNNMLKTVNQFCLASGMKLTASKCQWLSYIMRDGRRVSSADKLHINGDDIQAHDITSFIKYLGAPIATNREAKMLYSSEYLRNVKHEINQLLLSSLTFSQSLDAIRRLVTPKLDFIFQNGVTSVSEAKTIDENIRGLVQKKLKCPGLPIEVVHASWKDGGMNIPNLEHRLDILQIRTFLSLATSKDERIRKLIYHNITEEARKRRIERCNEKSFFGFSKASSGTTNTTKTNSIFCRALQAAARLKISLTVVDDNDNDNNDDPLHWINDSPLTNFSLSIDTSDEDFIISANNFLPKINSILKERYQSVFQSKEFRCHSFDSLKNSKHSNFFIGNCKAPTSDNLVKFALQARTNSLLTEEVCFKRNLSQNDKCHACGGHTTGSLMHRLNKCNASMVRITARHNAIARVISDGLRDSLKLNCPPLNENSSIFIRDEDPLPERSRNLKPDIWFITEDPRTHKRTINIIEITCPYGMLTDTARGRKSSLLVREEEKTNKYSNLIDDIKNTWRVDASLHVIVVSSLGAITKNTESTLKKLFPTKIQSSLIAKRCVIAAIRGSWAIFYGKDLGGYARYNNSDLSSDDNVLTSSDHLTDEEDGDILNNDN